MTEGHIPMMDAKYPQSYNITTMEILQNIVSNLFCDLLKIANEAQTANNCLTETSVMPRSTL